MNLTGPASWPHARLPETHEALDAEWRQWDSFEDLNIATLDSLPNAIKNEAVVLKNDAVLQMPGKTPQAAATK